MKFKALVVREENKKFIRRIEERSTGDLPQNDVLIKVYYSALNYKDSLSAYGNKGVTRSYPHTPGVDAAGVVENSSSDKFKENDKVLVTGYDLGMNTPGGFGGYISVPADWIVPLPPNLSLRESMIFGSAGFTAGLSLYQMEINGLKKENGKILITGASGGVGTTAILILKNAGFKIIAASTKKDQYNFLKKIGADEIIHPDDIISDKNKPLLKKRWAGVIDTVGGKILENAIKQTDYFGAVAVCGNALSSELNTTVFPMILRGVSLLGIDSAHVDMKIRENIWRKLSSEWMPENLDEIVSEISLDELPEKIDLIHNGKSVGKVLIKHNS